MALRRDEVILAFRLLLGREPESEPGIQAHMALPDLTTLAEVLLKSAEFAEGPRFKDFLQLRLAPDLAARVQGTHESRARLNVLLLGNCQVGTVGRLMQAMTGDIVARSIETTPTLLQRLESGEHDLGPQLASADLVFVQMIGSVTQAIQARYPAHAAKIRQFPPLNSSVFHPDCVYVRLKAGGHLQGPMGDYHSSIAFWAWSQGWTVQQALALYVPQVYELLGFHAYEEASRKVLVEYGGLTGVAIEPLLHRWMAAGPWMHTINHPRLAALADLTAELLRREGIEPMQEAAALVEDSLARFPVWPVYPPIAARLGGQGSYLFKLDRGQGSAAQPVVMLSLEEFVRASFRCYEAAGAGNIVCDRMQNPAYAELAALKAAPAATAAVPMRNPYAGLPDHHFWRRMMEQTPATEVDPVLRGRWQIGRTDKVATAGSCFAQHISRTLSRNGFHYFVAEAGEGLPEPERTERQFGVFSARYGNIYTARQLVQLIDRAYGRFEPGETAWRRPDGRWVDPFRPQVEPAGYATAAEVRDEAARHLAQVRALFEQSDVFVFTLGLTESWRDRRDGSVYPLAPGVVAGGDDGSHYEFVNFSVDEVVADVRNALRRLRAINNRLRFIFTVSPVPLIATYEDRHVLVSTIESKSILRAAIGRVAREDSGIDYFPSYEIITGHHTRGAYFAPDLRSVTEDGVAHVMRLFLKHYTGTAVAPPAAAAALSGVSQAMLAEQRHLQDVVCDEEAIERHRQ